MAARPPSRRRPPPPNLLSPPRPLPWFLRGITRDLVLFCLGIVIIVHEVFIFHGPDERLGVQALGAGLVGLPAILRANELRLRLAAEVQAHYDAYYEEQEAQDEPEAEEGK